VRACHDWKRDPDFAARWADALEEACDALEAEARRRAVEGVEEPVVSAGKLVCTVRRYSDTLLLALLRAHRPERFARPAAISASAEAASPEGQIVRVKFKIDGHLGRMDDDAEPGSAP
jgi:hypothetical protein